MNLALCVQTDEVPVQVPVALCTGSFVERAAKAGQLGVNGLELMTVNPRALECATILRVLNQNRLQAAAVASGAIALATGLTLLHPDAAKAEQAQSLLCDLIDFAAAVAAPLVTIGSFRGRLAPAGPGAQSRLVDSLLAGADYASKRGIRLVLEAGNRYELDFINTAEEGLRFIEEMNHPALGLLLDTFHVNIEERSWTKPFRCLLAAGKLWHVHLGDNNRLAPGQGLIDFRAVLGALRLGGYQGYLSAELLGRPDPDIAAQQTVAYMRPLLEEN